MFIPINTSLPLFDAVSYQVSCTRLGYICRLHPAVLATRNQDRKRKPESLLGCSGWEGNYRYTRCKARMVYCSAGVSHLCYPASGALNSCSLFSFLSSGRRGKIKLKLTTLPRISIHVVCRTATVAPCYTPRQHNPSGDSRS